MRSIAPPAVPEGTGHTRVPARSDRSRAVGLRLAPGSAGAVGLRLAPDRAGDGGLRLAPDRAGVGAPRGPVGEVRDAADRLDLDGVARVAATAPGDVQVAGLVLLADDGRSLDTRVAIATGHLDDARRAAGSAAGADVGWDVGWWTAVVGWLHRRAGRDIDAEQQLRAAHRALRGDHDLQPLIAADLAILAAASRRPAAAEGWLASVDATCPRLAVRRGLAQALLTSHDQGDAMGAELALLAGDEAAAAGLRRDAVDAWLTAARLGAAARVVTRLEARREGVTGAAVDRFVLDTDYARALAADDAGTLLAVARRLAARGRLADAADAATGALARTGDDRTRGLVAGLVSACGAATDPRGLGIGPVVLSPRQRQVAELVIRGLDDRTIAIQLGIRLRTAQNHLAAVYRRLGVCGRRELAAIHRIDQPPIAGHSSRNTK